ncbi:MAG: sigma-70 family RNA polymerase sigma factor [Planctomycetota bacterium]|jgi:RNA polymerase sigma-70 factor (ECF subfamily)|nr:sigma-70 family RNA polymerase sigma factor [Planctomycetota bacterium]MDP7251945.1 sigma-70 family RNA polymerase sigma factor [Planctomycetota bacterium]
MNENSRHPVSKSAGQQEFLRVFLANEREILRYVVALVPNIGDAQEIVQQTAVVLWEKFDQYDVERPFAPWACRFALNVTRQWMSRQQRWKALLDGGLAEELAARREQLRPEFDERLVHLEQCLAKLPEERRSLVDGYYFRQLDVATLAERAERTVDAIYKTLQRVRRQLRDCIERSLGEELTT